MVVDMVAVSEAGMVAVSEVDMVVDTAAVLEAVVTECLVILE